MKLKKYFYNILPTRFKNLEDLPLYNWLKLLENDFLYVRHNQKGIVNKKDIESFEKLYNEYLSIFGLDNKVKEKLASQKKLIQLRLNYIMTKDKSFLTFIELEEFKYNEFINEDKLIEKNNINQTLIYLSKFIGGNIIDAKKISVINFYELIKVYIYEANR